ncbi:MFS transporter [Streptomyces sp. ACA25]|uniref:MFS transporter n=1 Tax=Streptomyces sp. ACA25 TaxID=3022596 RepID=UPI002307E63D|nr:MFS transporter [Streptomyces sp. ACA25]MDB1087476.1 MFS transporter [Streptomyces sp. ACA25]
MPPSSASSPAPAHRDSPDAPEHGAGPEVPLRRHRPFLLLCAEQATSSGGRAVTALALPLLAITRLDAGPLGAASLMALTYLPAVLLSPFIGVLVDRARLRRLLAALTALHVLVIGSVPLTVAVGGFGWPQLFAVAALSGALTATVTVALQSALPRVVRPGRLMRANSVLTGTRTAGLIGGPALGGVLIGVAGPAPALLVECAAYALAVLLFLGLPARLNTPAGGTGPSARSQMDSLREGLDVLRHETLLRRQALAAAGLNLGGGAAGALFVLYAGRDLGLPAWQLGAVYAAYAVAAGVGVLVATPVTRVLGMGRTTQLCAVGAGASLFLLPVASVGPAFAVLLLYELCFGLLATVWMIAMITGRQLVTPTRLLGRVNAFLQAALTATLPVGALAGGALAARVGIVPVLTGAAAVALVGAAGLWFPRDLHSGIDRAARAAREQEPGRAEA